MECPVDKELLIMTERNGVEIDYCPRCRGVWLDRGELDKIIERSSTSSNAGIPNSSKELSDTARQTRRPKKKSSLLGELFDF